ncbi:MAG TPA: glucosamine-6-phosphate deaminase [Terriglobales bacterium]|nr:glucosamine-6-phosphate deaminase [Terriglobales bacterium]
MQIRVLEDKVSLGKAAAEQAAWSIRKVIRQKGVARIIAATGASQFEFLEALTSAPGIDWPAVEMFHLDEYVGLPQSHPASFRKYLLDRFISKTGVTRYHLLDPGRDPAGAARRIGAELNAAPIDIAFVGVGENGHLAFNDPPADFEISDPYLIVELNEACRQQQVNEGWFADASEVPRQAISMSVRQILKAKEIIAVVPDGRKAQAVKACFEGPISPMAPASILRTHANATIFLDPDSAALLSPELTVTK